MIERSVGKNHRCLSKTKEKLMEITCKKVEEGNIRSFIPQTPDGYLLFEKVHIIPSYTPWDCYLVKECQSKVNFLRSKGIDCHWAREHSERIHVALGTGPNCRARSGDYELPPVGYLFVKIDQEKEALMALPKMYEEEKRYTAEILAGKNPAPLKWHC